MSKIENSSVARSIIVNSTYVYPKSRKMAQRQLAPTPYINYDQLELEKSHELQKDLTVKMAQKGLGRVDSLRRVILSYVVANEYEEARDKLQLYFDSKRDFPKFQSRCRRHLNHCLDLVNAIESKRNFPGLAHLALAKRQELFDRVIAHFEELKTYLKQMEIIEKELKILDLRSTSWVVRAATNAVIFIFVAAFLIEYTSGMGYVLNEVLDSMLSQLVDFAIKWLPS